MADYKVGFGGKFGLQQNSQDASAVGWEYQHQLAVHPSQRGCLLACVPMKGKIFEPYFVRFAFFFSQT